MSYWYPQAAVELRIVPEDFKLLSSANAVDPQRVTVQARNVAITVNDYKTTDKFSLEIDYKNFPFDPRTIRACGVVISFQDMESLTKPDGSLNKIVPGASTKLNPSKPNYVFIGFVDEESIEFDDQNRTVKFEGRDCTALLIDQKYQANSPISLDQPVDVILRTLMSSFKATQEIAVVNNAGTSLPTLNQFDPDFGTSSLAGHKNPGKHESYWEIIQDLVSRAGLVCYMSKTVRKDGSLVPALVLTTPKDRGGSTDDIKFIYGKNIKGLSFKRKLGRFKGFNIQVRSLVGKKVLTAKIPEEATEAWGKGFGFTYAPGLSADGGSVNFAPITVPVLKPDGSLDKDNAHAGPYITFNVPNINNKDQLIRKGQTLYEQYSLQQLEGTFETYEMLGRGTNIANGNDSRSTSQYDLTQIVKGQTVQIEIDTDDLSAISRLSDINARTNYLILRNYDKNVAAIFASSMGKFSPRFQIKSYTMTLDKDQGFKLAVNFQNVIDLSQRGLT